MSSVFLIVNHEPVGQPRHRVGTINGKARLYLPSDHPVHAFKRAIRAAFAMRVKAKITGPIRIEVNTWFPRPKSKVWKTKPMPAYFHTSKPDSDNVLKAVLDALNGVAWIDDAQISVETFRKYVCSGSDAPRAEITICDLDAE